MGEKIKIAVTSTPIKVTKMDSRLRAKEFLSLSGQVFVKIDAGSGKLELPKFG